MVHKAIAAGVSAIMVLVSLGIMVIEGTITAEAWALLLLTPLPVGFAMARTNKTAAISSNSMVEWAEENEEHKEGNVGDPTDAGFDIPVL